MTLNLNELFLFFRICCNFVYTPLQCAVNIQRIQYLLLNSGFYDRFDFKFALMNHFFLYIQEKTQKMKKIGLPLLLIDSYITYRGYQISCPQRSLQLMEGKVIENDNLQNDQNKLYLAEPYKNAPMIWIRNNSEPCEKVKFMLVCIWFNLRSSKWFLGKL